MQEKSVQLTTPNSLAMQLACNATRFVAKVSKLELIGQDNPLLRVMKQHQTCAICSPEQSFN